MKGKGTYEQRACAEQLGQDFGDNHKSQNSKQVTNKKFQIETDDNMNRILSGEQSKKELDKNVYDQILTYKEETWKVFPKNKCERTNKKLKQ